MKENLVIIGANDFQNQLILRAKELGYTTHVFAWQCGDIGERTADFFYPISIVEKERILEVCRTIRPVGVCSIASDLAAITVNFVAEGLGLVGNGMDSAMVATNKHLMRQAFERAGLPSCRSILLEEDTDLEALPLRYPVIVKPTDRSGSRGIRKVCEVSGLPAAIAFAREPSFEKKVLVEEFGASVIKYTVRAWCKHEDSWDVHYGINDNVLGAFKDAGVKMSYEHVNVHMVQD